jgi:hypothetical protein
LTATVRRGPPFREKIRDSLSAAPARGETIELQCDRGVKCDLEIDTDRATVAVRNIAASARQNYNTVSMT